MMPGATQPVVEMILANERVAVERWRHGDPMGWVEIAAGEVTYIDPELAQPARGLPACRGHWEALGRRVRCASAELIAPRVTVFGELAVLSYDCVASYLGEAGRVVRRTPWHCTEVHGLVGGGWMVVHIHRSHVRQQPPDRLAMKPPVNLGVAASGDVLDDLLVLEAAAMERWRDGDPWGVTELCAPDVTYFDPGTPRRIDGLDALRAEYAKRKDWARCDLMELVDPHVQVHAEAAVLTYRRFSTVLNWDGSIASSTPWNCTNVFVRRDGAWRIVHAHWSYILGGSR
jgi:ketosteroid isomerase-like protein